jgi:RNA polymerase sigma factor (sigma-70 family)
VHPLSAFQGEDLTTLLFEGKDPTPSPIASRKELAERVEGSLLKMKEHHREVILLRLFSEMSYPEIGEALGGREEATVRKIYSRALAELRNLCE